MGWVVVETRVAQEHRVRDAISRDRLAADVLLPTYRTTIRHARRERVVEYPLWSRYLLADVDLVRRGWTKLLQVKGVLNVLGMPTALKQDVIDRVRGVADMGLVLTRGERIRFLDGPYAGIEALFSERDGDEWTFEIEFMKRLVPTTMTRPLVERVRESDVAGR